MGDLAVVVLSEELLLLMDRNLNITRALEASIWDREFQHHSGVVGGIVSPLGQLSSATYSSLSILSQEFWVEAFVGKPYGSYGVDCVCILLCF